MYRRAVATGLAFFFSLAIVSSHAHAAEGETTRIALGEPAISPDRTEIAFVAGGDIWTAPANGGIARLSVSSDATSSRPMYSPDGKHLAFESTRAGHADLSVLDFADTTIRRITHDDGFANLDGWSRDGATLYFDSVSHQIGYATCIMRVSARGGTPTMLFRERFVASSQAAPQPGGETIAFVDGGFPQWWRRGHSHIDESALALYRPGAGGAPHLERASEGNAVEHWPMWSADGKTLYYVSDRTGAPNLFARAPGASARQLTHFTAGRLVFPTISNDGKSIVFERDFGVWRYDVSGGEARELAFDLHGAPTQSASQHLALTSGFGEIALSPDGKKIAFTARGQIFAASAKDGGDAIRLTKTTANEREIVWAPDSRRIAYVSDRDGDDAIFIDDLASNVETRATPAERDYAPAFSPDGKSLAYIHAHRDLRLVDLATKTTRTLASGELDEIAPFGDRHPLAFSPDGSHVAYTTIVTRGYVVVDVVGVGVGVGTPHAIDRLANAGTGGITWSPDGKRVYFVTGQRTEPGQIAQIDLVPRTPQFKEDEFRKLFTERTPTEPGAPTRPQNEPATATPSATPAASPAPSPAPKSAPAISKVTIDFRDIRERASLLPTGIDVAEVAISHDGKTLVFSGAAAGQSNLYSISIDPLANGPNVAKQLTASLGAKSNLNLAADGTAYYLETGRAFVVGPDGKVRPLPLSAELDVDFATEKLEIFSQAWRTLATFYADPHFNGVDWNRVHTTYAAYVNGAHNPVELRRLLNLMVGELDSSHSGVGAPRGRPAAQSGYLGAEFDGVAYARTHRLRIAEILPLGPLALARGVKVGDELEAVDGTPLTASTNLEALLENMAGKRVVLRIAGHDVTVAPVDATTASGLAYRAWVATRRALVDKLSGGRLGYVHLLDMSEASLAQLTIDLDTDNQAKDGVVIDIRNNEGGFVDPYVTDIFSRRNSIEFKERGRPLVPERPSLGQRVLDRPTVLVTNAYSLSDAENFTEDYRRAHLGKVVGDPTAGWIIFTSGFRMVDGSTVRVPFVKTLTLDGVNMELHPRPVDVRASRKLGEDLTDSDAQLEAAVRTLQRELPRK